MAEFVEGKVVHSEAKTTRQLNTLDWKLLILYSNLFQVIILEIINDIYLNLFYVRNLKTNHFEVHFHFKSCPFLASPSNFQPSSYYSLLYHHWFAMVRKCNLYRTCNAHSDVIFVFAQHPMTYVSNFAEICGQCTGNFPNWMWAFKALR